MYYPFPYLAGVEYKDFCWYFNIHIDQFELSQRLVYFSRWCSNNGNIYTLDKHNITQSRHDKWLLNVRPGSTHSNNHGIGGSYIMGIPDRGVMLASKVTINVPYIL